MARAYPRASVPRNPLADVVARALAEDIGPGDVTSAATVPVDGRARAEILQKAPGVIAGLGTAEATFRAVDPELRLDRLAPEGEWREGGAVLGIEGRTRAILAAERTALNLLGRLSGVATLTARYVHALEGTGCRVLDTRKTTPGLRALEKDAVRAGGGVNHRFGLHDAVLIKENHAEAAGGVGEAVRRARAAAPDLELVVECRSLAEVDEALTAGDGHPGFRIMLDNMDPPRLREAVTRIGGRAPTEASGVITLESARAAAETGIDFISVGALTHSAPALDLSLLLENR
jgi:nicotinate-nucleotide pyrophosphorylase (carboxylating)